MQDVPAGGAQLKLDGEIKVPNEFTLLLSKFNGRMLRRCQIAGAMSGGSASSL